MKKIAYSLLAFAPVFAFAQNTANVNYFTDLINKIGNIIKSIIPLLFALAIIFFFWGIIQYFLLGDDKTRAAGKSHIIWGIVAIAVMASVYGLVAWLQNVTGVTNNPTTIPIPTVNLTS